MESFNPNPSTIVINSDAYRLVRNEDGQLFTHEYAEEPPWAEGTPALVSDPAYTWHLGGLKSRQGIPGSSEYGVNTDCRWPFQILPGPLVQVHTLTSSPNPPRVAIAGNIGGTNYVWAFSDTYGWRIDASGTVVLSLSTFDSQVANAVEWNSQILVTRNNRNVWQMTAIVGGGPDTWGNGADTVVARFLAKGFNRLFKISDAAAGYQALKNLGLGLDPTAEANWADEVLIPGRFVDLETCLIGYDRTVIINAGGSEGMFAVGEEGFGIPLARKLVPTSHPKFIEPYIYIPHQNGVARYLPGSVESIGIETEVMNDSPIKGEINGITSDGVWLYMGIWDGTNTNVLVGRERRGSEPGFGPIIWDTLFQIGYNLNFMEALWIDADKTWIVFNHANNLGYVVVPHSAGAPMINDSDYRFALSGTRFTVKYNFDDRGEKDFPKFSIKGSGLSAAVKWAIAYSIDGGAFQTTDINGTTMEITGNTLTTFFLPTTAHGVEIQFRFTYTSNTSTSAGRITYFEPFAIPRSRRVPLVGCLFILESGMRHEDRIDERTALEAFQDLQTLLENATAISATGPWSTSASNAFLRSLKIVKTDQIGQGEQRFTVQAILQLREAA